MKYFFILNFITGFSNKGHLGIPVSADFFLAFMDRFKDVGLSIKTFDVSEPSKATYYCVYESESYVPDHVCLDDLNVVGVILHS